jgi:hypothetical protein
MIKKAKISSVRVPLNNLNKYLSNKPTMRVLAGGAALWSRYNAAEVDNGGDHTGDGDYFLSL